jgi:HSP20 family protein
MKIILIIIAIVLLLVIGVQSYYTYKLSKQVQRLSASKSITTTQSQPLSSFNWQTDKWNPFEEFQKMQNEMNSIFAQFHSHLNNTPDALFKGFNFHPTIDLKEEKDRLIVKADIPGAEESSINVTVENQQLKISAKTNKKHEEKSGNILRSERFIGQFERVITLPSAVNAAKMTTEYKNGVLTVTLPKSQS